MPTKNHLTLILFLICITLAVYHNCLGNSFAYDDYARVVNNPSIRQLNLRSLVAYFTDQKTTSPDETISNYCWRPLATVSFAIDHSIWGLNARGYHIENVVWHIINAVLVYAIIALLLNSALAAFIGALVFAIHPVQTEVVAWISCRSSLLCAFFFLSSFLLHIRNRVKSNILSYSLLLVTFVLGLFSKEPAVMLPAVLIAYDLCFVRGKTFMSYLAYYLPFFLIGSFYVTSRFFVLGGLSGEPDWWGGTAYYNMLTAFKAVAEYIRLLLFPVGLGIEYPAVISKSIFDINVLASAAVISAAIFIWFRLRKERVVLFFMFWFFLTLLPASNIIPLKTVVAERFLYLPLVAFASLFAVLFLALIRRFRRPVAKTILSGMVAVILIFYAFSTVYGNSRWKDELTLYTSDVSRHPDNPKSHYSLGFAYTRRARLAALPQFSEIYYRMAIGEFNEVLRLDPPYYFAYFAYTNLADIYNEMGRYDLAVENFKKAKAIKEECNRYNSLSKLCFQKREYGKAFGYSIQAVLHDPQDANAYINLGNAYLIMDEEVRAKRSYSKAAQLTGGDTGLLRSIDDL